MLEYLKLRRKAKKLIKVEDTLVTVEYIKTFGVPHSFKTSYVKTGLSPFNDKFEQFYDEEI